MCICIYEQYICSCLHTQCPHRIDPECWHDFNYIWQIHHCEWRLCEPCEAFVSRTQALPYSERSSLYRPGSEERHGELRPDCPDITYSASRKHVYCLDCYNYNLLHQNDPLTPPPADDDDYEFGLMDSEDGEPSILISPEVDAAFDVASPPPDTPGDDLYFSFPTSDSEDDFDDASPPSEGPGSPEP